MPADRTRCSECGGEMEVGFMLDQAYGGVLAERWMKGSPQKAWLGGVKVDQDECRTVETDRCKSCGLLKSYAR